MQTHLKTKYVDDTTLQCKMCKSWFYTIKPPIKGVKQNRTYSKNVAYLFLVFVFNFDPPHTHNATPYPLSPLSALRNMCMTPLYKREVTACPSCLPIHYQSFLLTLASSWQQYPRSQLKGWWRTVIERSTVYSLLDKTSIFVIFDVQVFLRWPASNPHCKILSYECYRNFQIHTKQPL